MIWTHRYFWSPYHITDCLLAAGNKNKLLNQSHITMNIFTVSQFQGLSLDGNPTIEFKDRRLEFLADSATGLMFYDIQDIIDGYDCTGDRIITHVSYLFVGGFVFCFFGRWSSLCLTQLHGKKSCYIHNNYDWTKTNLTRIINWQISP